MGEDEPLTVGKLKEILKDIPENLTVWISFDGVATTAHSVGEEQNGESIIIDG